VRAAGIVEAHRDDEFNADRWYVVKRWLAMLPAEIKQERLKLLLTEAWIANCRFQLARVPMILERVKSLLRGRTAEPTLSGELAFFQGNHEYWEGHAESSRQRLEEAVSKLFGKEPYFESEAQLLLGLARCMANQKEVAVRALEDRIDGADSPEGQVLSRLIASLVFIHLVCGDLPRARVEAQRLRIVAQRNGIRNTEAWSCYMLACTHLHVGELAAASRHFAHAVEQRYVLEPMAAVDALAGLALTQQLLRLDAAAEETAGQLQEFAQEQDERRYLAVAHSCRARLSLLRGDLAPAVQWARSATEAQVPSALFMWLEAPLITQARALTVDGTGESLRKSTELLHALRQLTEECRFTCQTIEVAVLQPLALEKQGRADEALTVLEEVVALAEPGGWIRPFVELGRPMADLLERLLKRNVAVDYVERILAAFREGEQGLAPVAPKKRLVAAPARKQVLVEPLTNREEEVLELLAQRLSDKEIAERLFVSPATVNTHLKHIYEKLRVGNRREAVSRAGDLGILPHR
jgi:LuxR family maltose regulon positive regulatory protein